MDENDASILNFFTNKANMKPTSPMLTNSSRVRKAELKRLNTRQGTQNRKVIATAPIGSVIAKLGTGDKNAFILQCEANNRFLADQIFKCFH